jgi:hypothetical protein
MDSMSDGQLLQALSFYGQSVERSRKQHERRRAQAQESVDLGRTLGSRSEDLEPFDLEHHHYHAKFRDALIPEAQEAFDVFDEALEIRNQGVERVRDNWRDEIRDWKEANPGAAELMEYGTPDHLTHEKVVAPVEEQLTRDLRSAVTLSPAARENIIATADAYRPYAGEDEDDEDEGHISISFDRLPEEAGLLVLTPWDDRNYNVFAMLADVRNGGFRGEPQRLQPIAEPRGVPDDVSAAGEKFMNSYGVDGHSHTYYTLDELLAVPWADNRIDEWGVVSEPAYQRFVLVGEQPSMYSASIRGPGYRMFTPDGYDAWVVAGRPYFRQPKGRSWLDNEVWIDDEVFAAALAGEYPLRHPLDDPLRGGGNLLGEEAPQEVAFGLPGVRGDRTSQVVLELEHRVEDLAPKLKSSVGLLQRDLSTKLTVGGNPAELVEEYERELMVLVERADTEMGLPEIKAYVRCEWGETWAEAAGGFLQALEALKEWADQHVVDYCDVRWLCFFDN